MADIIPFLLLLAIIAPLLTVPAVGVRVLLGDRFPPESVAYRMTSFGLMASTAASALVFANFVGLAGEPVSGEIALGRWLQIEEYEIPFVLMVDRISVTFSLFANILTSMIARFSRTYLHKEPGFVRFFVLLAFFASGTQLIALAGALELFFAGWEIVGISSALFIGYFHERDEPIRSSVRAFGTYRFADAGLLLATATTFELLGSARFSAFNRVSALTTAEATVIALLFLLSAMGKSAQLPFSGWLPRAMEGPTPSSALFYGAVSIHAGLFLLLRVWPVLELSLAARGVGILVGLSTAIYASAVVRTHTDAKGALAHATLAQVGLILVEICLGWITLALVHLVCHALLRLGQYLKAPNTIHDSHRLGHDHPTPSLLQRRAPALAARLYAGAIHRLRLDERIDVVIAPALALAGALDRLDRRLRRALSFDGSPS
ncbi:MAG: proton-conducting transporter membrane subunit [Vicinamibacterales bacterium]